MPRCARGPWETASRRVRRTDTSGHSCRPGSPYPARCSGDHIELTRSAVRIPGTAGDRRLSRLRTPRELRLIALDDRALVDAPASDYRTTADAAEALHDTAPDADGIAWASRRFPAHDAFVLFGDRVGVLHVVDGPLALDHGPGLELAEDVAMRAGVGLLL